jgi:hypothetical protein
MTIKKLKIANLTIEIFCAKTGKGARATTREYTWEKAADKYEEIYFQIAQLSSYSCQVPFDFDFINLYHDSQ